MTARTVQPRRPANDDREAVAGRRVPVIGQVGDGGVVSFYPGGREWLDDVQRRLAARRTSDRA